MIAEHTCSLTRERRESGFQGSRHPPGRLVSEVVDSAKGRVQPAGGAFALAEGDPFSRHRPEVIILGGLAGAGKTDVLGWLAGTGEQVLDLERLANHRGSVF